jgi:multiple sugar transport system ATP-binding protein
MGMETLVYFTIDGTEVCARLDPAMAPEAGQPVTLMAAMSHMHLLDAETDKVL